MCYHFSSLWARVPVRGRAANLQRQPGTNPSVLCVVAESSAHMQTHTHAHTDTHLCIAETQHCGNTGASSDSCKVRHVHVLGTEVEKRLGVRPRDWAFCFLRAALTTLVNIGEQILFRLRV